MNKRNCSSFVFEVVLCVLGIYNVVRVKVCVWCCSGALDALAVCLEEFDPGVKEAAAWAVGYIARHNAGQYCYY